MHVISPLFLSKFWDYISFVWLDFQSIAHCETCRAKAFMFKEFPHLWQDVFTVTVWRWLVSSSTFQPTSFSSDTALWINFSFILTLVSQQAWCFPSVAFWITGWPTHSSRRCVTQGRVPLPMSATHCLSCGLLRCYKV
jgi:hypothetical protein